MPAMAEPVPTPDQAPPAASRSTRRRSPSRVRGMLLDPEPLRRDPEFRLVWTAQLLSNLGRQVTLVALPTQLYLLTRSPLAIGALALVNLIPVLGLSLGAGAVADAFDQRRMLQLTQSGLALSTAVLALLALSPAPPLPLLYLVALLAAAVSAIDQPVRKSALYRTVARERMGKAVALEQGAMQTAMVVGPTIGGVLFAAVGLPLTYGLDALAFCAAIAVLAVARPIPPLAGVARPSLAGIAESLAYVRSRPAILGTFVIDLDAMIFGLPVALFPILALDAFHAGPAGVGLLTSAPAAGALLGVLLSGWATSIRDSGRATLVAVVIWGLAITAFGLVTVSLPLALVFLAVAGAADVFSAVFRSTILQLSVPDALRGRLSAIHLLVVTGGPRLGDMEATGVAALTSASFSVISGGLLCIAGAAVVAWRFPELVAYRQPAAAAAGRGGASAAEASEEAADG